MSYWLKSLLFCGLGGIVACAILPDAVRAESPAPPSPAIDFVRDIQPIFASNCYKCHDAAKHKGGLRLDSKLTAFIGGDSGDPSIIPHDPDKSKIIPLVRGDDSKAVMPPKGKRLTAQQIDLLTRWVKQGADWPDGVDHPGAALTHWSFTAPVRPPVPAVKDSSWPRNPIDNFVLSKIERQGLRPSPEADRYTLIRRLSLDLIGLPPTPLEVQEFVNDKSASAYEKVVDRLQANPHYGEKWARHWLDLGRYADSAGYGSDPLALHDLSLARLGDRRVQSEQALRPVHHRANCRGFASSSHHRATDCDGLQSQHDDQHRGRHRSRGISH